MPVGGAGLWAIAVMVISELRKAAAIANIRFLFFIKGFLKGVKSIIQKAAVEIYSRF